MSGPLHDPPPGPARPAGQQVAQAHRKGTPAAGTASAPPPPKQPEGPLATRVHGIERRLTELVQMVTQLASARRAPANAGAPRRTRAQSGAVRSLTVPLGSNLDALIRTEADRLGWSQAKVAQDLLLMAVRDGLPSRLGVDVTGRA
jgi:hypothetical protein